MTRLTVTTKGQVTLKQELLRHLGVRPGQKIDISTLPDGRAVLQAAQEGHDIGDAFGILKSKNKRKTALTIEQMSETTRKGWAGQK